MSEFNSWCRSNGYVAMSECPPEQLFGKVTVGQLKFFFDAGLRRGAPVWVQADILPDSETTVMTYSPDSNEPIWPAYHDGEQWVDLMGAPIDDANITHWMNFPEPPETLPSNA